MLSYLTADQINAAIAAGHTVTARAADTERKHQPRRGQLVEVKEAFDGAYGEIRIYAHGYKGRFRAEIVSGPFDGAY